MKSRKERQAELRKMVADVAPASVSFAISLERIALALELIAISLETIQNNNLPDKVEDDA